jgi:hypothetical protein
MRKIVFQLAKKFSSFYAIGRLITTPIPVPGPDECNPRPPNFFFFKIHINNILPFTCRSAASRMHLPSAQNVIHAQFEYLLDMAQCRLVHKWRHSDTTGTVRHKNTNLRHLEIIQQKIEGKKKKEMKDTKIFFVSLCDTKTFNGKVSYSVTEATERNKRNKQRVQEDNLPTKIAV